MEHPLKGGPFGDKEAFGGNKMHSVKCALWAAVVDTFSVVKRLDKAIRTPYIQESGVCYIVILYTVVGNFFYVCQLLLVFILHYTCIICQ